MSKLQRLRDNIEAIWHALSATKYDAETLSKYTGFGGMTFVLNPLEKSVWSKSDLQYYELTVKLHNILKEYSSSEREYEAWVESLKASTLTAYYTPGDITAMLLFRISEAFYGKLNSRYDFQHYQGMMLDPAAGEGIFMRHAEIMARADGVNLKCVAYEKDLLSGMILRNILMRLLSLQHLRQKARWH